MNELILEKRALAKENGNPILRDKSFELLIEKAKEINAKSILEIGTNVGLSSSALLLELPYAKLTGIEILEDKRKEALENYKFFGVSDRAKIFLGDAKEILPMLSGEYDLIFLDGPKGQYIQYLPMIMPLLKKGGILFADNVLHRGFVGDRVKTPHRHMTIKHSLENFLIYLTNTKGLETQIYDIEDGVSVTKRLK